MPCATWRSEEVSDDARDEWFSRDVPRPHYDNRQRAIAQILADMWQMPDDADTCVMAEADKPLADRFREQAEQWDRETAHLSSPAQRFAHPSYTAILGM